MDVVTLRAFEDNYIYVLRGAGGTAAVVDPGDAAPVEAYLEQEQLRLTAILSTHHHADHVGGNAALISRRRGLPVYGGASDRGRIPGQTAFLRHGDEIAVCGAQARVLGAAGHTRGHIAYFFPEADGAGGDLFSGDTIFAGTIGHLFEGCTEEMFDYLQQVRGLPPGARIWCAHEYTLLGLREALQVDPGAAGLGDRLRRAAAALAAGRPTPPLLLADELATNPFLRWDDVGLQRCLGVGSAKAAFERLCAL